MYWLAAAAIAGTFAGIPIRGVPGIGEPYLLDPTEGWTAKVENGRVWVFVADEEEQAAAWLHRHTTLPPIYMKGVDDARGDVPTEILFRRGNVAVRVRADRAQKWGERLRDAIVDVAPSAVATTREYRGCPDMLSVEAPGAAAIQAVGRVTVDRDSAAFTPFPKELIYVWDHWGRARRVWEPEPRPTVAP